MSRLRFKASPPSTPLLGSGKGGEAPRGVAEHRGINKTRHYPEDTNAASSTDSAEAALTGRVRWPRSHFLCGADYSVAGDRLFLGYKDSLLVCLGTRLTPVSQGDACQHVRVASGRGDHASAFHEHAFPTRSNDLRESAELTSCPKVALSCNSLCRRLRKVTYL